MGPSSQEPCVSRPALEGDIWSHGLQHRPRQEDRRQSERGAKHSCGCETRRGTRSGLLARQARASRRVTPLWPEKERPESKYRAQVRIRLSPRNLIYGACQAGHDHAYGLERDIASAVITIDCEQCGDLEYDQKASAIIVIAEGPSEAGSRDPGASHPDGP